MRIPKVYLSVEDIQNEEIMYLLESYKVIGCYIWAPLDDYSFIARFKDLQDINIISGEAVCDLDFLLGLYECRMLFLQNAKLKNIDVILDMKRQRNGLFGTYECVGLYNCEVEDLSAWENESVRFSEFLVWMPEGRNKAERWNAVSAERCKYYELGQ